MNSRESWELHIDPSVLKALKKIPRRDRDTLFEVIHFLPLNPFFGDIQKMRGVEGTWRRRVGAYRIFYRLKSFERVILVFDFERRTSKTY